MRDSELVGVSERCLRPCDNLVYEGKEYLAF